MSDRRIQIKPSMLRFAHPLRVDEACDSGQSKAGDRPRAKTPVRWTLFVCFPTRRGDWNKMSPVAAQTHTLAPIRRQSHAVRDASGDVDVE